MKRALGLIMIAGLFLGVAACGSSSGSDSKSDTKTTSADSGDSSDNGSGETASGNADVKAYCKAVDEYVDKAKEAMNDPAKAQALQDESKELTEKAQALATSGLSADDAQAVADCTKKSTDALLPG